jgi:hypothetical protein
VKTAARYSLMIFVTLATLSLFAVNLPVANYSFETANPFDNTCGTNCFFSYGVPSWTVGGTAGVLQPGAPNTLFNYVPDGQNVAFIGQYSDLYQWTSVAAIPGTTYTLQFDVGWEAGQPFTQVIGILALGSGNNAPAIGTDPTQGNWSTFTAQITAVQSDAGQFVGAVFYIPGGGIEGLFDNVRLTATTNTPTPEPSTFLLLGSSLIGLATATRRRFSS